MNIKQKSLHKVLTKMPRYSYSLHNRQMEPITLIFIGSKAQIVDHLSQADWLVSEKISLTSSFKSALASMFNMSYRTGPMWPSYIRGRRNDFGMEKPTQSDTYRRRHHLRVWKTRYRLRKQHIWLGTISYDRGVGFIKHSLFPAHHIGPSLSLEEEFLARTLDILKPVYIRLAPPEEGHINTGDAYIWNGKALVLDLTKK